MVIHNECFLIYPDFSIFHFSDTDSTDEFIIVDGGNQELCLFLGIPLRCRNKINDTLKQRLHIHIRVIEALLCISVLRGRKEEGTIQLFIRCVEIQHQFQNFIDHIQ